MATFEVPVLKIDAVEDHPNADRLSICHIKDYVTISAKLEDGSHRYKPGEFITYVPEGSLVPENVLKNHGFWDDEKGKGLLAGKTGNRVKAIKLRGVLSQGIMLPHPTVDLEEGSDASAFWNITKYVPEIPFNMNGDVEANINFTYDIENLKRYPTLLDNKEVVVTEKLHGTLCALVMDNDGWYVSSKGFLSRGLVFWQSENNKTKNIYYRIVEKLDLPNKLGPLRSNNNITILFGEIYGKGIQDLTYNQNDAVFNAFDIVRMSKEGTKFVSFLEKINLFKSIGIPHVPILYQGMFDRNLVNKLIEEDSIHGGIREGVVITPVEEVETLEIGRLILKHVSERYLLRKGNTTEFN